MTLTRVDWQLHPAAENYLRRRSIDRAMVLDAGSVIAAAREEVGIGMGMGASDGPPDGRGHLDSNVPLLPPGGKDNYTAEDFFVDEYRPHHGQQAGGAPAPAAVGEEGGTACFDENRIPRSPSCKGALSACLSRCR
jgi:hypothetical protein